MNEQELLKRIAGLPREIAPGNDPWARIAARLDERVADGAGESHAATGLRTRRWVPLAAAAAALLAIALVVTPVDDPANTASDAARAAASPAPIPPPVVLAGSEAEYQAAFHEFIAIGESREALPSMAVEKIESGWADLRQVETALKDALAQNPNDPFLNRRMLELRARQLGFLKQLAALDHSNRRLTI